MDDFQRAQQRNAEDLAAAAAEEAQHQKTEADRLLMEREAERQRKIAENLGNA